MDFQSFIAEKTPQEISKATGAPMGTVYFWSHKNRIPRKHWDRLINKYRIGWKKLAEMEAISPERV